MTRFLIHPFDDMGVPAILANADEDGMRVFQSAVRSAHESGQAVFELGGIAHRVVRQRGSADIELGPHTVVWRFDDVKLVEMSGLIIPMLDDGSPGHQYVDDLKSPVETLIMSHGEYDDAHLDDFPELSPVPPSGTM
jgi:hypothetical protein